MQIKGVNIPIVISAGQSTSGVLCFLMDTTFEEEHEQIRVYQRGLTRTASDWKRYYMGMIEGPGLFSLGNKQHGWEDIIAIFGYWSCGLGHGPAPHVVAENTS